MKTIFLAAGQSNRVKPIADKNLLKFCGQELIIHLLKNAQTGGLENFIVVCNEQNKATIEGLLETHNFHAETTIQPNLDEGMAGGVWAGLQLVPDDEAVFVLGGNDFVAPEIYAEIQQKSADFFGGILAKKMTEYFPGGYLEVDANNQIKSIIEKPGAGNEPSDLVNIVAHYFRTAGTLKTALKPNIQTTTDGYEPALQQLFKTENMLAVEYDHAWQAVKYPWHILDMQSAIFDRITERKIEKSAEISEQATLIGDQIVIGHNVKIMNGATLVSPCYIGDNSIVGQNCLIRDANIGADCVIGFCSEISRSFLADNVSTHHAYVGDSVVDSGVNFGAFSCTTNLRLDKTNIKMPIKDELIDTGRTKLGAIVGADAQIGSGAKIFPGRKVPVGTFVEPNSLFKG